jgi:predicted outer membrane repeat protein
MRRSLIVLSGALCLLGACVVAPDEGDGDDVVLAEPIPLAVRVLPAAASAVVGGGTAASCTEAAFTTAVAAGGTVTFACGPNATTIVLTSPKTVTRNTTIKGASKITLSGNLQTRLLDVASGATLNMDHIVLEKAFSAASDGAAISSHGRLVLSNATIRDTVTGAGSGGAAIYADGPSTRITGCLFENNTGGTAGAILLGGGGGPAQIERSTLRNNFAAGGNGKGGAIFVSGFDTLTVKDSTFFGNRARFGGAIYVATDAAVNLLGSPVAPPLPSAMQLNANSAVEDGGAIYNDIGILTIDNAGLSANVTPQDTLLAGFGGAIFSTGTLRLSRSTLFRNEGRFGGAIYIGMAARTVAAATIDRTRIKLNASGNLGGGLYTSGQADFGGSILITNSAIEFNTAKGAGGGLARFDIPLRAESSSFTGNSAQGVGGGLFLGRLPNGPFQPYIRLQSVTIAGNTAPTGGGLYNSAAGVELYSVTLTDNSAAGVYTDSSGNTRFRDAIVQNPGGPNCITVAGSTSDDGANFASDLSCNLPNASSQQGPGLDARLAPLAADLGGVTSFRMPLAGSPVLDRGFNCPTLDQLQASRVGACDLGAVELGGVRQP